MRGESHRSLGRYLVRSYLDNKPKRCIQAFLLGCIEPDRNPATYLKGSLRNQWLRGHNYCNAFPYMLRLSRRLEQRDSFTLLDYYALGKLIHYTTDAFTYAHNIQFPNRMEEHRTYEAELQKYFLSFIREEPDMPEAKHGSIIDTIRGLHREYIRLPATIQNDARYSIAACRSILQLLFPENSQTKKPIPSCNIPPLVV